MKILFWVILICFAFGEGIQSLKRFKKDKNKENPIIPKDIYDVGVLVNILQTVKMPNGTLKVLVEGNVLPSRSVENQTQELLTFRGGDSIHKVNESKKKTKSKKQPER